MDLNPQYCSIKDFGAITGLSVATIHRRIEDGTIPAAKIGRRKIIPIQRALEAIAALAVPTTKPPAA